MPTANTVLIAEDAIGAGIGEYLDRRWRARDPGLPSILISGISAAGRCQAFGQGRSGSCDQHGSDRAGVGADQSSKRQIKVILNTLVSYRPDPCPLGRM